MINSVVLVGRLTKDIELRRTQSGLSVASFTVACDRRLSAEQKNSGTQSADFDCLPNVDVSPDDLPF